MTLAHVHILLNHFPTIGMIVGMGLYVLALIWKSDDVKRASLAVIFGIAAIAIATYISGSAAFSEIQEMPGISKEAVQAHQDAALLALAFMELAGITAWLALWQYRRIGRIATGIQAMVLVLGLVALGFMSDAANIGGEIHHPEIVMAKDAAAHKAALGHGFLNAEAIGAFVTGKPWMWPTCETLHFVGLSLLLGVVLAVDLRMLGFMKGVSFATLHRLLPWGILGFAINVFTGMFFFVGAPEQYTMNKTFYWKILFVMLAAINGLYFTVLDEPWVLGSGDEAPLTGQGNGCLGHGPVGGRYVLRQHAAVPGQRVLRGRLGADHDSFTIFHPRCGMYLLGLTVLGLVVVVTAVFALVAYLIDRGEAKLEENMHGR